MKLPIGKAARARRMQHLQNNLRESAGDIGTEAGRQLVHKPAVAVPIYVAGFAWGLLKRAGRRIRKYEENAEKRIAADKARRK